MAKIPVRTLVNKAAAVFDVPASQVYGPARFRPISRARQAVYLAATEQGWGVSHIGRILNRDHSTVTYGVGNARELVKRDDRYRDRCSVLHEPSPKLDLIHHD